MGSSEPLKDRLKAVQGKRVSQVPSEFSRGLHRSFSRSPHFLVDNCGQS